MDYSCLLLFLIDANLLRKKRLIEVRREDFIKIGVFLKGGALLFADHSQGYLYDSSFCVLIK